MPISADLGPELEAYVEQLVKSGRYNSTSEVLRAGVTLLQKRERPLSALNDAFALPVDLDRARVIARRLHDDFAPGGPGILGQTTMPEDISPAGLAVDSREHLLFIMLTASVDYVRDADALWNAARTAHERPDSHYLFEPSTVLKSGFAKVEQDLKRVRISKMHGRDAHAWFTICEALANKWRADPAVFLRDCDFDAPTVLKRLQHDTRLGISGPQPDFPLLRGPKIGSVWVRMLRDNCNIELARLDEVPIPVDVHILRATLCSGVIKGRWVGNVGKVVAEVCRAWRDGVKGLKLKDGKPMVALDVDAALWTLSRRGCSTRGNGRLRPSPSNCPCQPHCTNGEVWIANGKCRIDTR